MASDSGHWHARAILLVPGWGDRARVLRHLQAFLIDAGFSSDRVHAIEFRSRFGSNISHAHELAAFIGELVAGGVTAVDIVAHSMGGLAVRQLLDQFPAVATRVRRVITLGSPHSGTFAAWLIWGDGAREMRPGSAFLKQLRGASTHGAELVSIRAPFDVRILPGSSSVLAGARNFQLPCLGHRDLLRRRRVLQRVRELLEEP